MVPALAAVRGAIARAVLGDLAPDGVTLGTIVLRPHQVDVLVRVRSAIAEFGGALLADEAGLGKTYVALALAGDYGGAVVAAPAALRTMWREAAAATGVPVTFVSLESLSRHDASANEGLVIVDEAHHASNPSAARYARLSRLMAGAHSLLLTATPVRNRAGELSALLALFLGPFARSLDGPSVARLVLRRSAAAAAAASAMPSIIGPIWHASARAPDFSASLRALPAALPALDGAEASALVVMSLARCWASSLAALDAALRRRLQRGAALDAALQAGRLPTRAELRGWLIGDDAVQLAFPLFVSAPVVDAATSRAVLARHLDAVRTLRARVAPHVAGDICRRARRLVRIRARHTGARVLAFTAHAATGRAMYAALRRTAGVVLLTADGARSAGGSRPRADIIAALGPRSPARRPSDDITLVIATDVLSEGVNLQGASVVVHLDLPWTPAGLDQRVGRAARIGSTHRAVIVHAFAPPPGAERLLALGRRHHAKNLARRGAGLASGDAEWIRDRVRPWWHGDRAQPAPRKACVRGGACGFVAVVRSDGNAALIAGLRSDRHRWRVSNAPRLIRRVLDGDGSTECPVDERILAGARSAHVRWCNSRRARATVGLDQGLPSGARRRVLARVDDLLCRAPPHTRATLERRVNQVREGLARCSGVAAESALHRLASDASAGTLLLEKVEEFCSMFRVRPSSRPIDGTAGAEPPAVETLLLIVP